MRFYKGLLCIDGSTMGIHRVVYIHKGPLVFKQTSLPSCVKLRVKKLIHSLSDFKIILRCLIVFLTSKKILITTNIVRKQQGQKHSSAIMSLELKPIPPSESVIAGNPATTLDRLSQINLCRLGKIPF